jgi:hypothetical protein
LIWIKSKNIGWDERIENSQSSDLELSENRRVGFWIKFIVSNVLVESHSSEHTWKPFIKSDVLNEANHIVSCNLVNFLICQGGIFLCNILTNSVVLSDKNCMNNCQQDVLIDSSVSGNEFSIFSLWQEVVRANLKFSLFEYSETVSSFLIRTINVAGIKPRWHCVDISSDFLFYLVDWTGKVQLLFSSAKLVKGIVTSSNWNVERFVSLGGS